MRIMVINPFAGTEFFGRENLAAVARPDTEFEMTDIGDGYPLRNNQWLYFRHACTGPTLEKVMQAEKEGYDAVFISCNLDIGLYEAREIVDIPVTATLESAAHVAYLMGMSYSLVTVDEQNGRIQKMMLDTYNLSQRFVSLRPIDIDANDLYPTETPAKEVVDRVVEVSKKCVEEDGAEVIIPGCTLAGSVLTHELDDPVAVIGAPVIDGMIAGFKMAEMMADLRLKAGLPPVSRRGFFQFPPEDDFGKLREFNGKVGR